MTLLIASAFVESEAQLASALSSARRGGADALELRVDLLSRSHPQFGSRIRAPGGQSVIITCRTCSEGGRFDGNVVDAANRVLELVEGSNAGIDVAMDAWRADEEIRSIVKARLDAGSRLILSAHFPGAHPPLESLVHEILQTHPRTIAKIAYSADHAVEAFPALDLMRRHGPRVAVACMGEMGAWTRVLARKLGAFGTYASLRENASTAPGQWTVDQLLQEFGWSRLGTGTRVFGVVGDPVAHSLSPRLFNYWFRNHGLDAVYLPIRVGGDDGGLVAFMGEIERRTWLDFAGVSVTIPHKADALRWAGDCADPMSREIGAANTLVLGPSARAAYNTDGYAAVDSLAGALGCSRSELAGMTVDVLGAGGSARAVCHSVSEMGCKITLFARTPPAKGTFEHWGAVVRDWEERAAGTGEVLINCTPVGMWPQTEESPMPDGSLRGRRLVFDLIYRPLRTKLLRDAEACGCATLGGLDMFVRQARTQFSIWMQFAPEQPVSKEDHKDADTMRADDQSEVGAYRFLENILCSELGPSGPDRRVTLVGARGAGKSSVGRILSALLGQRCIDTDELVASSAGISIAEIFSREGEAGFRRREAQAAQQAVAMMPAVISLGGGAITSPEIVAAIRRVSQVVWLTARPEELLRRVQGDPASVPNRPSLTGRDHAAETREVLRERESKYHAAADLILDTEGQSPEEVARRIFDWMRGEPDKRLL